MEKTASEKAQEIYYEFGDGAERVTEEIIGALYDYGTRRPQYWYDVQEELNRIIESEDESDVIHH